MNGRHVNFAAVRLDRRKKILCVIMAIALIGLMVPHGLLAQVRAFAEQNSATTQYHESINGIEVPHHAKTAIPNGSANAALSATFSSDGSTTSATLEMYSYDDYDWYGEKDIDIIDTKPITDPTFPYAFFDEYSYYYVDAETNILVMLYDTYQGEYRIVQVLPYEYGSDKFVNWTLNGTELVPGTKYLFNTAVTSYAFSAIYAKEQGYAAKLQLFSDKEDENIEIRKSALPAGWSFSPDGLWASKMFAGGTTYEVIYSDFLGEDNSWALHLAGHQFSGWTPKSGDTTLVADTEFTYNFVEKGDITVKAFAGKGEFTDYQYYEEWQLVEDHYEAKFAYDSITMGDVVDTWAYDYPHKNGGVFDKWSYTPADDEYLIADAQMTATYRERVTYKVEFNAEVITNGLLNNREGEGGYIDGAGSYYIPEESSYYHNYYEYTYILMDDESDLYRSVIAVANDGYEFDGWVITPEGAEDEGTVTCDMTFTAKFKSLGSAIATIDFTNSGSYVVKSSEAGSAGWVQDQQNFHIWTKAILVGAATVQDIENEWTEYATFTDGNKYTWTNNNDEAAYYSTVDTDTTWTPHKIAADDYQLTVTSASDYGFNATLDDVYPGWGLSFYQFANEEVAAGGAQYIDTHFSKYSLDTKSSYGLVGYQIIDNCLYYGYVNEKEADVWYYGIVQPDLTGAENPYVQWSVNGDAITTSDVCYFKPDQKAYNFTYEVKESVNVRGQVADALTGEPIAYEYVSFIPNDIPSGTALLTVETSDMGLYYMNIPNGTAGDLKVEVYGYATEIVNVSGTEDQVIDIKLYPKLEISGRVIGVDGTQFKDAMVTLHDADTDQVIGPALTTNDYGYYRWWNENSVVLKDPKYYADDGSLTKLYVEVQYQPFYLKDPLRAKYEGPLIYGGDAAYNAEDIILEPKLNAGDWSISALDGQSDIHRYFVVYGQFTNDQGHTFTFDGATVNLWNQTPLYHGTKVGITQDYALHLEYKYDNSPSGVWYDLYFFAEPKELTFDTYAWSFNSAWLHDYVDPYLTVDFTTLNPSNPQAKFEIEYKETVSATIEAEGVEGHGTFHTDYFINDPQHLTPVKSWDSPSINDNIYVGTRITLMENGQLHLEFKDSNLTNSNANAETYDECGIVTPIPAEGYQLVRWTLNGAVFNVGNTYTVKNGDVLDLSPAYELINPPENIDASAQTGDASASVIAILAIVALTGFVLISTRREFNIR